MADHVERAEPRILLTRLTARADIAREIGEAVTELRQKLSPGPREVLAGAIRRHGGPTSVLEQAGYERGKDVEGVKWKSARRVLERYQTEAGEKRAEKRGIDPKYARILRRVLGDEEVDRINAAAQGKGELPKQGEIVVKLFGYLCISENCRDQEIRAILPASQFAHLQRDPLDAWETNLGGVPGKHGDYQPFVPRIETLRTIEVEYYQTSSRGNPWAGVIGRRGARRRGR